jgi:hypothetical protein
MALARLLLLFLLVGKDSLQHVARLGNVREVDLGSDRLRGARGRAALTARARSTLKLRANLLRLVIFK